LSTIVQLIPSFARYDAIGIHTRRLDALLTELGHETAIYADEFDPSLGALAEPFAKIQRRPPRGAWYLYQASTNSRIANWLRDRPRVIVNYHNVTPHELTKPWEPSIARVLWQARREIGGLARTTQRAFTVSHYNAHDLFELGFLHSLVAPPLLDLPVVNHPAPSSRDNWLFVGRIFPNKNQLFLLEAFSLYRSLFAPEATLTLVGQTASESYRMAMVSTLESEDLYRSVRLLSGLSPEELATEYATATVFTCASLHEGFGFPFIEAFAASLPVLALDTSAVGETVGGAGWLLGQPDPLSFATAAHLIATDRSIRDGLIARGRARLNVFAPQSLTERYATLFERMLGNP
jgi:glycosyltransferase involved in cell wall biosynthesis